MFDAAAIDFGGSTVTIVAETEPDTSYDRFARIVKDALSVPVAFVDFAGNGAVGGSSDPTPAVALSEPRHHHRWVPLVNSLRTRVVADRRELVVTDARDDVRITSDITVDGVDLIAYVAYPLHDLRGRTVGAICAIDSRPRTWTEVELRVLEDVASACSAELALRESQAALSRSYERLTLFAGQVSHDLKAPLTAIIGFVELLGAEIGRQDLGPKASGYIDRCSASGRRMLDTIDELLEFAAIGTPLQARPVSLDEVMPSVLEDVAADLAGADVVWSGVDVPADPLQLRLLLQNLIGNALKYRRGDRQCTVCVSSAEQFGHIELRIADNGTGIPAHRRAEVVQPLVRLRRDVPGSGLGLATCDRIVTAHHGVLQLSDTPGGGTTVTVHLPATPRVSARKS